MTAIKNIMTFVLVVSLLDMAILFCTIMQIASGEPTPHIPFWDAQIKVVATLIK